MTDLPPIARDVVVRGRVQGVFFRDACRRAAGDAGVAGWVSNEPDGSVRARLEGAAEAVDEVLQWMHQGPPHAEVEAVEVTDAQPSGAAGFEVR